MGNRGCIHRDRAIVRAWATKRWITCALEYKGWVAPKWAPGRWTALFFYDEAVALAAGHRPCALCRRGDYERFCAAIAMRGADPIDARLHSERLEIRKQRWPLRPWRSVPPGAFVDLEGKAHLVLADALRPWLPEKGYGARRARPGAGDAHLLTAPSIVAAIEAGYVPQMHA